MGINAPITNAGGSRMMEVGAVAISSFDTYLVHGLPQIKQRAGLA